VYMSCLLLELECLSLLIPKSAVVHDPKPVPFTSCLYNLFP